MTTALLGTPASLRCFINHARHEARPRRWTEALEALQGQACSDYDIIALGLREEQLIEQTRGEGRTVLHLAALLSNSSYVSSLVSYGASTVARDARGLLPPHYAILGRRVEAVKFLFPKDAKAHLDLSQALSHYENHLGNREFSTDYSKFYFEEARGKKWFLLPVAIEIGDYEMVSRLLELGADPNQPCVDVSGGNERYPLHIAAKLGRTEIFSALLGASADIEQSCTEGWRPLHFAVLFGHAEIVRNLLDAGADVTAATKRCTGYSHMGYSYMPRRMTTSEPWTGQAIHLAAMQGYVDTFQLLLERRADVKAETVAGAKGRKLDSGCGPTATHIALTTSQMNDRIGEPLDEPRLRFARLLIEAGADVSGVGDRLKLEDVLKFKDFGDVWDRVREGITENGKKI